MGFDRLTVTKFENCVSAGQADAQPIKKTTLRSKGVPRWYFALTAYNNDRLVVSGGLHLSTSVEVFAYYIQTNEWRKISSMSKPRSNHSSCALKSRIYFVGGCDSSMVRQNSIEYIDMNSNERGTPMEIFPGGREMPVFGAVSDTKLLIMGGIGDIGKLSEVLTFSINE